MNFHHDIRMKTISFIHRLLPHSQRLRGLVSLAVVGLLMVMVISCSTINRRTVALPDMPGAKYVGSADCEQCHDCDQKLPPSSQRGILSALSSRQVVEFGKLCGVDQILQRHAKARIIIFDRVNDVPIRAGGWREVICLM